MYLMTIFAWSRLFLIIIFLQRARAVWAAADRAHLEVKHGAVGEIRQLKGLVGGERHQAFFDKQHFWSVVYRFFNEIELYFKYLPLSLLIYLADQPIARRRPLRKHNKNFVNIPR